MNIFNALKTYSCAQKHDKHSSGAEKGQKNTEVRRLRLTEFPTGNPRDSQNSSQAGCNGSDRRERDQVTFKKN